jgi:membrane-associated phospholipid phosphatase
MISGKSLSHTVNRLPGSTFLLGYVLVFPALLVLVLTLPKEVIHLRMNAVHAPFLDVLMKYWTMLGDGLLLPILIAGLMLISFRHALTGLAAFAIGGIGAQVLKRLMFGDYPRPVKFFELAGTGEQLYLVEGVDLHTWMSFPSGHTSTAFAVFFALALMTRSAGTQCILFLLALGVGYSRIYLSQHFLVDVVAGSFLGLASGWIAWRWIRRYDRNWLSRSLFNYRK